MFIIEIIIVILAILLFISYAAYRRMQDLPENNPSAILTRQKENGGQTNKQIRVICIGDSITQGTLSCNYVDMLQDRLGAHFFFINAGVNGDTSWNVLNRLEEIRQCEPDLVTLMIGTNDTNTKQQDRAWRFRVRLLKKLPQNPDLIWFKNNLDQVLERICEELNADIAILSIPTIGEELSEPIHAYSEQTVKIIKDLADKHQVTYLPLFETMTRALEVNPSLNTPPGSESQQIVVKAASQHLFQGQDYDMIARKFGYQYHVDPLHLNCIGAEMIADLIEDFIRTRTKEGM